MFKEKVEDRSHEPAQTGDRQSQIMPCQNSDP